MKRGFDLLVSGIALVLLAPLLLCVAVLVKLTSPGPVFFRQERIGVGFRPFQILKFRTMREDASGPGMRITVGHDPRITRAGAILRAAKIDELPQLINVFLGQMSFVGPRPELPKYVEAFRAEYREILEVRPGMTDPASIKYRSESQLLAKAPDAERFYAEVVLPDKLRLAREYVRARSFFGDLRIILETIAAVLIVARRPRPMTEKP